MIGTAGKAVTAVKATAALAGLGGAAALAWAARQLPAQFGAAPTGDRAARVEASPQWRDGKFHNRPFEQHGQTPDANTLRALVRDRKQQTPRMPVPLLTPDLTARAGGLHVTWFGHSSALIELDGARILIDPIWEERVSPSPAVGPKRLHDNPIGLADLGEIDAVVISHDHYDHLEMATMKTLAATTDTVFVVPLGIGAHLEAWGVPLDRIRELDWSQEAQVRGVRLVCTAAQHFSGRNLNDRDHTLWASWAMIGPEHKVFYSGDGGYFDGFAETGEAYGPFDLALIQIGAYSESWRDIHMMPEEGIATAVDVQADLVIPVHWGTFRLAAHPWGEPVDRAWAEAKARDVHFYVPRPGERVTVDEVGDGAVRDVDPWWQLIAPIPD